MIYEECVRGEIETNILVRLLAKKLFKDTNVCMACELMKIYAFDGKNREFHIFSYATMGKTMKGPVALLWLFATVGCKGKTFKIL